jgi:hypothetical protein
MNRVELVQFLESVKAGKVQLTSNVWKLESGSYFRLNGELWELISDPVFSDVDHLICYSDQIPDSFPGQVVAITSPDKHRIALQDNGMLEPDEIETKIAELPTVSQTANNIVALIRKLNSDE